ncbi:MAG: glycosyltransferase family 2 protein [Actinomycetota bacterium]
MTTSPRTSIAVYVCTHKRNEPLRRMLTSLSVAAERVQPEVEIAVVVIDDNPDGRAKEVVEGFGDPSGTGGFARGLHYRHSGAQNISVARNLGLEATIPLGEWVAMTDDDQVVVPEWFEALLDLQERTGADAITGPVHNRYAPDAPAWLTDQPFHEIMVAPMEADGAVVETCSTGNSMLRSSFLTDHPEIRFRKDLGVVGGEDMVFYKAATGAGLDARFSTEAVCYTEMPPERERYRYTLRSCYWLGNSIYLTNIESGDAGRGRLVLRAGKQALQGLSRPVKRLVGGNPPQWRYAGAIVARSFGILVGVIGIRVAHP